MAPSSSSSSAKKVAKLAQRGKGKKVRFQGGTVFPAVVVGILVVGLVLIGYSRQSVPDPGSFPPQQGDHWHAAYGMYVCDGWLPKLAGAKEETVTDSNGNTIYVSSEFQATGIHSHDDGVIHWHPNSTRAIGKRAVLGVFLDVYDVELSSDRLALPEDQGGDVYEVGEYQCNGEDVEIKVVAWDSISDTGEGQTYVTDLENIRLKNDGMVFSIAVVAKGADVAMPPWAPDLPELGAADMGAASTPTSTIPTDGSTPATSSTVADTAPATTGG